MSLVDHRIVVYEKNIKDLPDRPVMSAANLKAYFDGRTDAEIKEAINGIIDLLIAATGADEIGAQAPPDVTPVPPVGPGGFTTIQAVLLGLRNYVDEKLVQIGAGDMAKLVYDPNLHESDAFAWLEQSMLKDDFDPTGAVAAAGGIAGWAAEGDGNGVALNALAVPWTGVTSKPNISLPTQKTLLWSGSWSTGSITVPDLNKYELFQIDTTSGTIIAWRFDDVITGVGTYVYSSQRALFTVFRATFAGDTITGAPYYFNIQVNTAITSGTPYVTKIYGFYSGGTL